MSTHASSGPRRGRLPRRALLGAVSSVALTGLRPALVMAARKPLLVIAHPDVGAAPFSRDELALIFGRSMRERGGVVLRPLNLPPRTPERVEFDWAVFGLDPERAAQFWVDKLIRGEGGPPRQVPNGPLAAALVGHLTGALSYVEEGTKLPKVNVVARIYDRKVLPP